MSDQSKKTNSHDRRSFLKFTGVSAVAAALGAKLLTPLAARAQAGGKAIEMVKPTDSMAQSLGYIEDAKKVDTKKWPKRAGKDGAKQFCYNCQFYAEKKNPKASKAAGCTIFAGKGVTAQGWCNSWTQDPTIKD